MKKLLFAICATLSMGANAQTWAKEPDTIFGIKLGVPVASLALPTCPPKKGLFPDPLPTELCILPYEYSSDKFSYLFGTPDLGVRYTATLVLFEGEVRGLLLSLDQSKFEMMKAILIERYGKPTEVKILEVTTGAGAKFSSQEIRWKGKNINITATERVVTIDESSVIFTDKMIAGKEDAAQESKKKGAALKF
jgi:hypothetical protein